MGEDREDEVTDAGAVGHDEGAEYGAFDAALGEDLESPDHEE